MNTVFIENSLSPPEAAENFLHKLDAYSKNYWQLKPPLKAGGFLHSPQRSDETASEYFFISGEPIGLYTQTNTRYFATQRTHPAARPQTAWAYCQLAQAFAPLPRAFLPGGKNLTLRTGGTRPIRYPLPKWGSWDWGSSVH